MMTELLMGCGFRRDKIIGFSDKYEWDDLTTLDINPECNPDVIHDLEKFPYPFPDNTFDEIHAYEVLEHMGTQGDYEFFFAQFSEIWRILKPLGLFLATVPTVASTFDGDPGHKRVIGPNAMLFLSQETYNSKVGETPVVDYRGIYKADFNHVLGEEKGRNYYFALQAVGK